MNIGIIGAGNIGGNLTRRFRKLGHKVFVANSRGPESLADLAAETGATPVTVHQAAPSYEERGTNFKSVVCLESVGLRLPRSERKLQ